MSGTVKLFVDGKLYLREDFETSAERKNIMDKFNQLIKPMLPRTFINEHNQLQRTPGMCKTPPYIVVAPITLEDKSVYRRLIQRKILKAC